MLPRVLLLSMLSVAMACASNKAAETSPASYLIHGVAPLRFLADPIGGNRTPVSDEILVQPGDEVTLTIPS